MSSKVLKNIESYARLLDGSGNILSSTAGALNTTFSGDVTSSTHDNFLCNATMQIADVDLAFGQALAAASLPVVLASDQTALPTQVTGTHANASNAQTTAAPNEDSTAVDLQYVSKLSAFGNVSQACTVKLFQSQDGTNYYETGMSYTAVGSEDFYMSLPDAGARYYKLQYSASGTTVTATIAGKN